MRDEKVPCGNLLSEGMGRKFSVIEQSDCGRKVKKRKRRRTADTGERGRPLSITEKRVIARFQPHYFNWVSKCRPEQQQRIA
ncbi:unnamed protein product [Toxocara canis]|uniref:Homeobox domain-containing protein n=1 Tax=Toxocara canis TaxID=6265 RepID=A0A183V1K0_TOXCA|nr:unnamed protein product [Toxocara canis]